MAIKRRLFVLATAALAVTMAFGFAACYDNDTKNNAKLTETEWVEAINKAMGSTSYIVKSNVRQGSGYPDMYFEIRRSGNIAYVRSGSQYSEWMYYYLDGDTIHYYYTPFDLSGSDNDSDWRHEVATGVYVETFKHNFDPPIDNTLADKYDKLTYDESSNTYTYAETGSSEGSNYTLDHTVTIENGDVKSYVLLYNYYETGYSTSEIGSVTTVTFEEVKLSLPKVV